MYWFQQSAPSFTSFIGGVYRAAVGAPAAVVGGRASDDEVIVRVVSGGITVLGRARGATASSCTTIRQARSEVSIL